MTAFDMKICTDRTQWDAVLAAAAGPSSFYHSWEWADFQEQAGRAVHRLLLTDAGAPVGVLLLIDMPLSLAGMKARYVYSPRGPVLVDGVEVRLTEVAAHPTFQEATAGAWFWRVEPLADMDPADQAAFKQVADVAPRYTRMLDIGKSEEELLADMKQKTRYNVRLAGKKQVEVAFEPGSSAHLEAWWKLLTETSGRHGVGHHPKGYYAAQLEQLGSAGVLEVVTATHEGDVLAMNINIMTGNTYVYVHGASTSHKRNLMAPYALQWEAVKRAQAAGYRHYDFYGVGPRGESAHKLAGVTRFKTGFGGEEVEYPGTFELPLRPLAYRGYRAAKSLRRR